MAPTNPALSFTGLFVLQALNQGHKFGFDIMEVTGLPSGTIYPALRRLEALDLVTSDWERDLKARKEGRPRRRYYQLTKTGKEQLGEAEARFMAVGRLFPKRSPT
ncbi:MAG: helix-turn-helix transcriptional regulator [Acidobacteria bacterium]|nr:helix-turn-helix transcriptional regulator [Acidobacteriota bacterium]